MGKRVQLRPQAVEELKKPNPETTSSTKAVPPSVAGFAYTELLSAIKETEEME